MTDIIDLVIGNRQSYKTTYVAKKLYYNMVYGDPESSHIIFTFTPKILKDYLGTTFLNKFKNRLTFTDYKNIESEIRGITNLYVYFDEFDFTGPNQFRELYFCLQSTLPATPGLKKIIAVTTPAFLRDSSEINTSHAFFPKDPLLYLLHLTDFNFTFLFNADTASYYIKAKQVMGEEQVLCEGLGMISKFD